MWRKLLISALTLLAQTQAEYKVDSVCIHELAEAGPDVQSRPTGEQYLQETDLSLFSLMGDTEKEFS